MDYHFYLKEFESALTTIDKRSFDKLNIRLFVTVVMESAVIKAYKPEWSGDIHNPLTADSRVFFSIWVNEKTIAENKVYYNIHALQLRKLKGYKISSRGFAERFRNQFTAQLKNWTNVDIKYGPLTLMQGWLELNMDTIQKDVTGLLQGFLKVSPIIDMTLKQYKI